MRRIIVIFCLCMGFIGGANANTGLSNEKFVSRKIKLLAELLPMQQMPENDTIMNVPQVIKNKSLIFTFNNRGEISHIGISLFSDATKFLLDKSICNFLERFLLELMLQENNQAVERKLAEYHVTLLFDGKAFGKGNMLSLGNILEQMDMPVKFALRHQDKRAEASWRFGRHTLNMSFPLYRELIDGTDKKESDDNVYHQLQSAAFDTVTLKDEPVDGRNLQPLAGAEAHGRFRDCRQRVHGDGGRRRTALHDLLLVPRPHEGYRHRNPLSGHAQECDRSGRREPRARRPVVLQRTPLHSAPQQI